MLKMHTRIGLLLLMLLGWFSPSFACHLSELRIVSVTGTGPVTVTFRMYIGMGLTGTTKGGDDRTKTVGFGFYDATPGLQIYSISPAQMISPAPPQGFGFPRCRMTGVVVGPNTSLGTSINVVYPMPNTSPCTGATGTSYGCVHSTIICGPVLQSCSTYTVVFNQEPDSMIAFGAEANGIVANGCFGQVDMRAPLKMPEMDWGTVEAQAVPQGVEVRWSTLSEWNADYFLVEHEDAAGEFQSIAEVPATGALHRLTEYSFQDHSPLLGRNRYRIVWVTMQGFSVESNIFETNFQPGSLFGWNTVGPNPVVDGLDLTFFNPDDEIMRLKVLDGLGKVVMDQPLDAQAGGNAVRLEFGQLEAGAYFVSVEGKSGRLVRRIVKR